MGKVIILPNETLVALQLFTSYPIADKSERMHWRATKIQPADTEVLEKSNVYCLAREQLHIGRDHNHTFLLKIISKKRKIFASRTQSVIEDMKEMSLRGEMLKTNAKNVLMVKYDFHLSLRCFWLILNGALLQDRWGNRPHRFRRQNTRFRSNN